MLWMKKQAYSFYVQSWIQARKRNVYESQCFRDNIERWTIGFKIAEYNFQGIIPAQETIGSKARRIYLKRFPMARLNPAELWCIQLTG